MRVDDDVPTSGPARVLVGIDGPPVGSVGLGAGRAVEMGRQDRHYWMESDRLFVLTEVLE